jgi:hypothetical protein
MPSAGTTLCVRNRPEAGPGFVLIALGSALQIVGVLID